MDSRLLKSASHSPCAPSAKPGETKILAKSSTATTGRINAGGARTHAHTGRRTETLGKAPQLLAQMGPQVKTL
jgi:hypothetical protein